MIADQRQLALLLTRAARQARRLAPKPMMAVICKGRTNAPDKLDKEITAPVECAEADRHSAISTQHQRMQHAGDGRPRLSPLGNVKGDDRRRRKQDR